MHKSPDDDVILEDYCDFFSVQGWYGNSLLTNYNMIVTIKLSSFKSNIL